MGASLAQRPHRNVPVQTARVFTASCWRCAPKRVKFLPVNVMHGDDWKVLVADVAAKYPGITAAHLTTMFVQLCRAVDYPDIVVRVQQRFLDMFDVTCRRALRLLVLHAQTKGLWTERYGSSRVAVSSNSVLSARSVQPQRRRTVEFDVFVCWLLEVISLDFFALVTRIVEAVFPDGVARMSGRRVRALLTFLCVEEDDPRSGTRTDELVSVCLRHLTSFAPEHTFSAFVELLARYPIFAHPILRAQFALQRKFMGVAFWRQRTASASSSTASSQTSEHAAQHQQPQSQVRWSWMFPLPLDVSLRYCRVVTARTLLLEAAQRTVQPLQFGSAFTVAAPKPPPAVVVPDVAVADSSKSRDGRRRRRRRRDKASARALATPGTVVEVEGAESSEDDRRERRRRRRRGTEFVAGGGGSVSGDGTDRDGDANGGNGAPVRSGSRSSSRRRKGRVAPRDAGADEGDDGTGGDTGASDVDGPLSWMTNIDDVAVEKGGASGSGDATARSSDALVPAVTAERQLCLTLEAAAGDIGTVVPRLPFVPNTKRYCYRVAAPPHCAQGLSAFDVVAGVYDALKAVLEAMVKQRSAHEVVREERWRAMSWLQRRRAKRRPPLPPLTDGEGEPGLTAAPEWLSAAATPHCLACSQQCENGDEELDTDVGSYPFTGFCFRCVSYLFRCLADAFGYKLARVTLEAASVTLSLVEALDREYAAVSAYREEHPKEDVPPRHWILDGTVYSVIMDAQTPFYYNLFTGQSQWKVPRVLEERDRLPDDVPLPLPLQSPVAVLFAPPAPVCVSDAGGSEGLQSQRSWTDDGVSVVGSWAEHSLGKTMSFPGTAPTRASHPRSP